MKWIEKIFTILTVIILFPLILIFSIISLIIGDYRREFKKLKKIGFKYKYKKPKHIFTRDNIIIEIFHTYEDYYISFDNGQTFERVEDTNLGLPYNRENLKFKLNKYKYTSGLERQRGEAFPPLPDFIDFLVSILK